MDQEQTQNSELAFLTEQLQYLQNRIAILESYNEMAAPYVSSADIELVRKKFQRYRMIQAINKQINLDKHVDQFKEITRIQIPHHGNPRALLTIDIHGYLKMDSPLIMFAMESPNATLYDCTQTDPLLLPFPYTTYPRYSIHDARRAIPSQKQTDWGRVRVKLTSDILVTDLTNPVVEIILYTKHRVRYSWLEEDTNRYPPPYFLWTTHTIASSWEPYENVI